MTERRRLDLLSICLLALVPTLLFIDILAGANVFYTRDIVAYYHPAKKILRDIVLGGEFPYWNPFFSAGQPLAANPEHEVFYPLTWLILLPSYELGLQLLALVHVYVAVFTTWALLRSMELSRPAAAFGAVSFGLGGIVLSTLNLFPCLFSLAWLPLTCLYTRRFLLTRSRRAFALAASFLGLQLIVGEPVTALQSGILLGLYALAVGWSERRVGGALRRVADIGAISAVALLVAAVQILPAVDHVGDSVRSRGFSFDLVKEWSTPLPRLAEVAFPHALGSPEVDSGRPYWGEELYPARGGPFLLSIYSGLAVAVLAAAGVVARVRGRGLFVLVSFTSLVLALGGNTPLFELLYDAGVARSLRYPEKLIMIGIFAAVVFSACTLERLLAADEAVRKAALAVCGAVALAAAAILFIPRLHELLFYDVWMVAETPSAAAIAWSQRGWIVALVKSVLLLVIVRNVLVVRRPLWLSLFAAFVLLDLGPMAGEIAPRQPASFLSEPPAAVRQFEPDRHAYRLLHYANWGIGGRRGRQYYQRDRDLYWVIRNAMAPMTPAAWGIRTVFEGDFDLTALLPTADFERSMLDLAEKNSPGWLNVAVSMSNVRYVGVYEKPQVAAAKAGGVVRDIQPVRFLAGSHPPRYYFAGGLVTVRDRHEFVDLLLQQRWPRDVAFIQAPAFRPAGGTVRRVTESANRIALDVTANGPAFLVMSVTPHKYWTLTIDGRETPVVITNVGYQGVPVPPGDHRVEMRYSNPLIAAGGAVSLAALLALFIAGRKTAGTATMRTL